MCPFAYSFHIWDKLDFTQNVTYDLFASTWRYVISKYVFLFLFLFLFFILINLYLGLVEEEEKTYIYGPPPGSTKPTSKITKHVICAQLHTWQ